jgi:hypothetical protein
MSRVPRAAPRETPPWASRWLAQVVLAMVTEVRFMAAARSEYSPDQRGVTPHRQLLTVSELEQLFGPDATVELRGGRPEHVETDLEVIAPRRTSRWMAPVLLVVFGAASLLGYALLRGSAPVEAARSVNTWTRWTSAPALGPTEDNPVDPGYTLPPIVARISHSGAPPAPAATAPAPSAEELAAELDQTVPAPEPEALPREAPAANSPALKVQAAKPAPPARRGTAPRAAAIDPAREDEATRQLIERQLDRLDPNPPSDQKPADEATYPPGYIEAEIR